MKHRDSVEIVPIVCMNETGKDVKFLVLSVGDVPQ